jgi:hypothetical protein
MSEETTIKIRLEPKSDFPRHPLPLHIAKTMAIPNQREAAKLEAPHAAGARFSGGHKEDTDLLFATRRDNCLSVQRPQAVPETGWLETTVQ